MRRWMRRRLTGYLPGLLAAGLVAVLSTAPAAATERRSAKQLASELGPGVTVTLQSETRRVGFIGTEPGAPIARPGGVGAGAPPKRAAAAFLGSIEAELGVGDAATELRATETNVAGEGRSSVRFQQLHDAVPVIGAELVVNLDADNNVLSVSGETEPDDPPASEPALSAAEADDAAFAAVGREHGLDAGSLSVDEGELSIYDSRLLGGPGLGIPRLVWRFEVRADGRPDIRQLVLVDAELGVVALSFNQVADALDREVCDAGTATAEVPCVSPERVEPPGSPSGPAADSAGTHAGDLNAVFDYTGDTYDFFFDRFGRDSLDGAGMKLISTIDHCSPGPSAPGGCPGAFNNAFWNGSQMVYGDGLGLADDVVGHELGHGFTDFTSRLFYYYQSGAINESLSDVFGEFIDQSNGAGSDGAGDKWKVGEDIATAAFAGTCSAGHELRNMSDPPLCGDPDAMTAPEYHGAESDSGGVHINSGVNNKATFLMTDGGTHPDTGITVSGIGLDKVAAIYHEAAANLLTSASDYFDLYNALSQACSNLTGTLGITAADCAEVTKALDAVAMSTDPPAAPTLQAATCDTGGETPADAFYDDLETPAAGNWAPITDAGTNSWYYPQNTHPFTGFDATWATSGTTNLWGYDQPGSGGGHDYSVATTASHVVPVGGYLHFNHGFAFDDDGGGAYDGGVVEYSTDGGTTWSDLGPMMTDGGYTGTISSGFGVPAGMDGRDAFVRESNGYGSTRADLASLEATPIWLRFRIGADSFAGADDFGWFIDDPRIYGCAPETTITQAPQRAEASGRAGKATADATPSLSFSSSSADPKGFECSVDGAPFSACASGQPLASLNDGSHTVRVRALGSRLTPDPTPAAATFNVTAAACAKAKSDLKKAKKIVKKAKKKVKKAKKSGSKSKVKKAKKKLKKAKKKLKKAKQKKSRNC